MQQHQNQTLSFNNLIEANRRSPNFGGAVSLDSKLDADSLRVMAQASARAESFGIRFRSAMSPKYSVCPVCRGYDLERSWCDHCNKSGLVVDREDG